jgi:hypothetical protein
MNNRERLSFTAMAGLVPAIHVFRTTEKDVDARIKSAHDDRE